MIPATVVLLRELPLTPNGKVDRQRLLGHHKGTHNQLLIVSEQNDRSKIYVEPRDKVEYQLQRIWEEVLNVQPIGAMDNFFDLGGHSLLAIRIISRIQKQFGQKLATASLFQHPTLAELATIIRQGDYAETASALVPLQPLGSKRPFFCIHPSGGSVFRYARLARYLGLDQPFYGLQPPDLDGEGGSLNTVEDMA